MAGLLNQTFDDLALNLKQRRTLGYRPPVLLLGAGASKQAGIGTMEDLYKFSKRKNFADFCRYIKPLRAEERYLYLSEFLQTQKPAEVTPGYQSLAALCAENYFDIVLTTNLDPLLDDALAAARLWRKDYLLLVNGVVRPERLDVLLREQSPRVKIIKLHGDLFHRYMAWTPEEMDDFVDDISPQLTPVLNGRDMLVVGNKLGDERIRELVVGAGGAIWYTHPQEIPPFLKKNARVRAVVGAKCRFEELFTGLSKALGVERASVGLSAESARAPKGAKEVAEAETIDDLMASVVGLMPADGSVDFPICTGFVLAQPRVIVTEGFAARDFLTKKDSLIILTSDNRRLKTRVVRRGAGHPFAPVLIEVPAELKVPGFRLDKSPPPANLPVRVGVAAGKRVGISGGVIVEPDEMSLTVAPIGTVNQLVAIDCTVAPGSGGGPVLDDALAVRGYIVAGAHDEPPSFMYPANRWAAALAAKPAPKAGGKKRAAKLRVWATR